MAYTAPDATPAPIYDQALDDIFHDLLAGITGIPATLVRPRWQPDPPNQPDFTTNWVAFGVQVGLADTFPWINHDPTGNAGLGSDQLERDEGLKVLCSFYGPAYTSMLARFRDGIQIESNRYDLEAAGIFLIEFQEPINLPALLKEKWVTRIDVNVLFKRRIRRSYSVNTIVALPPLSQINNLSSITKIIVP